MAIFNSYVSLPEGNQNFDSWLGKSSNSMGHRTHSNKKFPEGISHSSHDRNHETTKVPLSSFFPEKNE